MSVQYLVAPYEADAQIAFVVKNELADFAISEDSDLLAYGCKKVVFHISLVCQLLFRLKYILPSITICLGYIQGVSKKQTYKNCS